MKLAGWIAGFLVSLVVVVYVVVFTSLGNSFMAPVIQSSMQQKTKLPIVLDKFSLSISDFDIVLHLDKENAIFLKGKYSLFSQNFDIDYGVNLENLSTLKPLTNLLLRGDFHTSGKVKGDMDFFEIDGVSDVAKSDTAYHVELRKFNPTSIIAKIKKLKLDTLLYMVNQNAYASSDINLDIDFKNITPHAMDGDIKLQTRNGILNTSIMKKDFNITVPSAGFCMKLDAKLKKDNIDYIYLLNSSIARFTSSGNLILQPLKMDIKYGVIIKELAVLKPLSGVDVKGDLKLNGTLKGKKDNLINKLGMSGKLDNRYLSKVYKFKSLMPRFKYVLNMQNNIKPKNIDTAIKLRTTLADLDVKKATLSLPENSLVSDYALKVPSLDKLYFVTERHIRGGIIANGEIKKDKDFDFTAHSNIAGGKLDAKLHNDDFHADLKSVQTIEVLHMLIYPEIFKSTLDAKVDYSLAEQKGKMKGYLNDGRFTKNQVFALVKQYAKIDLCAEKFKGDVSADINKENILASLDLKSNTSSVKTKNTYLNSKTKKIKSVIDIEANHNPITVKLSGATNSPKVEVDATKLIKREAQKAVEKEAGKLLKGLF